VGIGTAPGSASIAMGFDLGTAAEAFGGALALRGVAAGGSGRLVGGILANGLLLGSLA
jgi:hypothetical protein